MSDRDPVIYGTPQAVSLPIGNVEIGSYVVNDYLITVTADDGGNGYLFTIRKGSEVQTIHLTELTQEAVNSSIETALSQAKESGEFDGNGIESVVFNPDYTLSLYFTDGTSVTTGSIKGAKGDSGTGITSVVYNNDHTLTVNLTDGTLYRTDPIKGNKGDTGVGIASAELNSNHTLTIRYTDGTSYTTPSIRGDKGDKGDKGDPGDSIEFHICSSSEYDHVTMTPTVANPKSTAFYLVPSTSAVNTDLFIEWVYVNGAWEKFGSATINLDSYATKTEVSAKMDKATNTGSAGQVLTSNGSGGQTWSNAAVPDWNAASGTAGFIRNKPDLKAGTGADSITNRHSMVSGSHSMATGTNNTISGADSYATGSGNNVKSTGTLMTGSYNTAELRGSNGLVGGTSNSVSNNNVIAAGSNNAVSGINSAATGNGNTASGSNSSVSGENVVANHRSQSASGEYNVPDQSSAANTARGNYVEIIGNGTADNARSNARTLDWNGNEWIKGNFKMGGNSYDDPNAEEVATKSYVDEHGETVTDVQVNGTSVLDSETGVAEIPVANDTEAGVVKVDVAAATNTNGVCLSEDNILQVLPASSGSIKSGIVQRMPIVPATQHRSVFYGLAKAAGDSTQSASSNPVGTYTDSAKSAIKAMLGVTDPVSEIDDTAGAGDTDKTWSADKISSELANAGSVQDVTVNDTSIVDANGNAAIPKATNISLGLVKGSDSIDVLPSGTVSVIPATETMVKELSDNDRAVTSGRLTTGVFYGLAKAAGDSTQSASLNTVGTYTDNAKSAIKAMLGVGGETQKVTVSGTAPVIVANQNTRYVCGEVVSLNFTPSADGICDVLFTSGSTATVLTIPNTVRFPEWFDPTTLEVNKIYEISISDGVYGAVMIW